MEDDTKIIQEKLETVKIIVFVIDRTRFKTDGMVKKKEMEGIMKAEEKISQGLWKCTNEEVTVHVWREWVGKKKHERNFLVGKKNFWLFALGFW